MFMLFVALPGLSLCDQCYDDARLNGLARVALATLVADRVLSFALLATGYRRSRLSSLNLILPPA